MLDTHTQTDTHTHKPGEVGENPRCRAPWLAGHCCMPLAPYSRPSSRCTVVHSFHHPFHPPRFHAPLAWCLAVWVSLRRHCLRLPFFSPAWNEPIIYTKKCRRSGRKRGENCGPTSEGAFRTSPWSCRIATAPASSETPSFRGEAGSLAVCALCSFHRSLASIGIFRLVVKL